MARRSSARLHSKNSSTPKRVSLSHDAPTRTPRTVPARLYSLQESDEMPGSFPRSESDTPTRPAAKRVAIGTSTPKKSTPIKPSEEEMHPQQHHQTTVKAFDEARHLGFSNMGSYTEPPKQTSSIAALQATPTKLPVAARELKSPEFQFTFLREHSLELSPEAKRLMFEKREEAAHIRDQMIANGQGFSESAEDLGRKMATPKKKKGRFSDAHMEQFQNMESIAGHASLLRAPPKILTVSTPSVQQQATTQVMARTKSLKRSPSKAELDRPIASSPRTLQRSPSKLAPSQTISLLPRAASARNLNTRSEEQSSSPAKRMKLSETDEMSVDQQTSSGDGRPMASTPRSGKTMRVHPRKTDVSRLDTPTQALPACASTAKSAKASRIPEPTLTPSKLNEVTRVTHDSTEGITPLLARSPSKTSLFPSATIQKSGAIVEHLLAQSPLKASPAKRSTQSEISREPVTAPTLLLAQSPSKLPATKSTIFEKETQKEENSAIPLLSRSPAKITLWRENSRSEAPASPGTSHGASLAARFGLLRSSPMKSILRSPQRLYSDDPAKVAAGTHLATPPKLGAGGSQVTRTMTPATISTQKHVDFSNSTKARADKREASSTPSKVLTPLLKAETPTKLTPTSKLIEYPVLPSVTVTPSPAKRRQSIAPGDFTFRAGDHGIIFGNSPKAAGSSTEGKCLPTIRHVSTDANMLPAPATGSKKRKFEFENSSAQISTGGETEDKENAAQLDDGEKQHRAKRAKSNPPERSPTKSLEPARKTTTKRPTLGVKPKGAKGTVVNGGKEQKKPGTISQARLNALAQPKRRA